jgi:hypothetical protein
MIICWFLTCWGWVLLATQGPSVELSYSEEKARALNMHGFPEHQAQPININISFPLVINEA